MSRIKIPEEAHSAIAALGEIGTDEFAKLIDVISSASPQLSRAQFVDAAVEKLEGTDRRKMKLIVREIFNFDYVRNELDLDSEELSKEFGEAIEELSEADFPLNAEKKALIPTRIKQLIEAGKSLNLTAKASDVISDHDKVFISSRLFTDLRPVFDGDGNSIRAFSNVHTLVLHLSQDGEHKDFYIALDDNDISELRDVLDRAGRKAAQLKSFVESNKIPFLTP